MSAYLHVAGQAGALIPQSNPAACRNCTAATFCGEHYTPEIEEAGWNEVAERMDRWGANGYVGHWQDGRYESTAAGSRHQLPPGGSRRPSTPPDEQHRLDSHA